MSLLFISAQVIVGVLVRQDCEGAPAAPARRRGALGPRERRCRGIRGRSPSVKKEVGDVRRPTGTSTARNETGRRGRRHARGRAGRVWQKMTGNGSATCAEFRQDFRAYLGEELGASRRILVEDHLSRCPGCRARIAEMKGERPIVAMPLRSSSRWCNGEAWPRQPHAVAVGYLGRDAIDAMMAPGGPRATVVSADGGLYPLAWGLSRQAPIGEGESVRTGPGPAVLRLADGSMVDVNEGTELFVSAAWSGQAIHLQRGDIIVKAAKQRRGRLRVLTRDSIASVKGTVFAVSAGMGGSVVSVVEGSVAVNQPGREVVLSPGQQAASIPALASSARAVSWSPEADSYLELLGSFVKIERELANYPPSCGPTRLCSRIFPPGRSSTARSRIRASRSAGPWPSPRSSRPRTRRSGPGGIPRRDRGWRNRGPHPVGEPAARGRNRLLCQLPRARRARADGDGPGARQAGGARERTGRALRRGGRVCRTVFGFRRSDGRFKLAVEPGVGPRSPGAGRRLPVCGSHRRAVPSAAWAGLSGCAPIGHDGIRRRRPPVELAGMIGMNALFLEQRAPRTGRERGHVRIPGGGTGMGSWLADAGSGARRSIYRPMPSPPATFRPASRCSCSRNSPRRSPGRSRTSNAAWPLDDGLGAGFIQNLTAALGTEAALALTGLSTSGPTWVMAIVANNPSVIDSSLRSWWKRSTRSLGPTSRASGSCWSRRAWADGPGAR